MHTLTSGGHWAADVYDSKTWKKISKKNNIFYFWASSVTAMLAAKKKKKMRIFTPSKNYFFCFFSPSTKK
jgi:hypothetical protein